MKKLTRFCIVCGKKIIIKVDEKGKYDNGHFFGEVELPIEDTGKWKKVGKIKISENEYDVVDWTGKKKSIEYWECNECFEE